LAVLKIDIWELPLRGILADFWLVFCVFEMNFKNYDENDSELNNILKMNMQILWMEMEAGLWVYSSQPTLFS
jgi:hypothetical protein